MSEGNKVVIDPKYTKLKRRTKMEHFAVRLTETRDLWYYLEATSEDTAIDEAKALHHEQMYHLGKSDGGADEIDGEIVNGEAHELAQY